MCNYVTIDGSGIFLRDSPIGILPERHPDPRFVFFEHWGAAEEGSRNAFS
jgi:hypothetical protein